jgi:hypothetical protein
MNVENIRETISPDLAKIVEILDKNQESDDLALNLIREQFKNRSEDELRSLVAGMAFLLGREILTQYIK